MKRVYKNNYRLLVGLLLPIILSGCIIGTAVGVVVDTAIEVAKVPFKVGGAIIDVVDGDDDFREKIHQSPTTKRYDKQQAAVLAEQRGL